MTSKRLVFLGSRPLGKFALQHLMEQPDVDLIGKVVLPNLDGCYWKEDPNQISDVPTLKFDDLHTLEFDIGLSVNYWRIVPENILNIAHVGFFNVHHSYNLMYRGRYINTFAILNARRLNIWHHGATLHRMTKDIDVGEIVGSIKCDILESDTAISLFNRVECVSKDVITKFFPNILENKFTGEAPSEFSLLFRKRDMIDKEVDVTSPPIEMFDKVRALDFPPFEPAYAILNGEKKYLTIREEEGCEVFRAVDSTRRIWIKKPSLD